MAKYRFNGFDQLDHSREHPFKGIEVDSVEHHGGGCKSGFDASVLVPLSDWIERHVKFNADSPSPWGPERYERCAREEDLVQIVDGREFAVLEVNFKKELEEVG